MTYVKAPIIFTIAIVVFNTTDLLAGGVGLFPYAGIFASYESQHSLGTLSDQFTLNTLGLLLCLLTIHTAEPHFPAPLPLVLGWLPVLAWAGIVRGLGWVSCQIKPGGQVHPRLSLQRSPGVIL